MGLTIATNVASEATGRSLNTTSRDLNKSYQRLASGQRITQAGDDASGLAVSEKLRAQIRSLSQAERNANDGISFTQVAEGGLTEVGDLTIRLRELAIQASSDTVGDSERGNIQKEASSLIEEVNRIAAATNYNGTPLLNGQSSQGSLSFQVGINNHEHDHVSFNTSDLDSRADVLGIAGLDYQSIDSARSAIERTDGAMEMVLKKRASLGAMQNKLESSARLTGTNKENLSEARSRIADTDYASETAKVATASILQSAGIAVLSQANSLPQAALKLI